MDEIRGDCGQSTQSMSRAMMEDRRKQISFDRRKELQDLSQEAADWIVAHNIQPHELCLFKNMVAQRTDVRD